MVLSEGLILTWLAKSRNSACWLPSTASPKANLILIIAPEELEALCLLALAHIRKTKTPSRLMLEEIVDLWIDSNDNPPEARCYIEEAFPTLMAEVKNALAADKYERFHWRCKANPCADPPQDCDWPNCGCDPQMEGIMRSLIEAGWAPPNK